MTTEKLLEIWEKIKAAAELDIAFLKQSIGTLRTAWDASSGDHNGRVLVAICALAAATAVISLLSTFFRANWKGKLRLLLWAALAVLALGFVLWYALK